MIFAITVPISTLIFPVLLLTVSFFDEFIQVSRRE